MECAQNVRVDKIVRPDDRPVNVRFRGEVHYMRDRVPPDEVADAGLVTQVNLFEHVSGMLLEIAQILQMACVGQAIQVNEFVDFRLVDDVPDQVRADEACAASH